MKAVGNILVMHDANVATTDIRFIVNYIQNILSDLGISRKLKIQNLGTWRDDGYTQQDGSLKEYSSVEWFMKKADEISHLKSKINAANIILNLKKAPIYEEDSLYIFVTSSDICNVGNDTLIGLTINGSPSAVVSTFFFSHNKIIAAMKSKYDTSTSILRSVEEKGSHDSNSEDVEVIRQECLVTAVMHELGHLLGLPGEEQRDDLVEFIGSHCGNICTMRQGKWLPDDWLMMTADRLKDSIYCEECMKVLRQLW